MANHETRHRKWLMRAILTVAVVFSPVFVGENAWAQKDKNPPTAPPARGGGSAPSVAPLKPSAPAPSPPRAAPPRQEPVRPVAPPPSVQRNDPKPQPPVVAPPSRPQVQQPSVPPQRTQAKPPVAPPQRPVAPPVVRQPAPAPKQPAPAVNRPSPAPTQIAPTVKQPAPVQKPIVPVTQPAPIAKPTPAPPQVSPSRQPTGTNNNRPVTIPSRPTVKEPLPQPNRKPNAIPDLKPVNPVGPAVMPKGPEKPGIAPKPILPTTTVISPSGPSTIKPAKLPGGPQTSTPLGPITKQPLKPIVKPGVGPTGGTVKVPGGGTNNVPGPMPTSYVPGNGGSNNTTVFGGVSGSGVFVGGSYGSGSDHDWHHGAYGYPSCGHHACYGHSYCSFGSHFHDPCNWDYGYCDPYRYRSTSFGGFWFGSGFFFGFSYTNYEPCYDRWHPTYWSWCDDDWHHCDWRCRPYCRVYYVPRPVYLYPAPVYTTYYAPVYSQPYPVATTTYATYETYSTTTVADAYSTTSMDQAWQMLANQNYREARRYFDRAMNAHPNDGLAQIGYALAASSIYRNTEAVSMMRRALRNDPEAIRSVPRSAEIDVVLGRLLTQWQDSSNANLDDADAHFMVAALRYMLGDSGRALFAIDRTADLGDTDASSQNLRIIIRQATEAGRTQSVSPANSTPPVAPMAPMFDTPSATPSTQSTNWAVPY